MQSFGLSRDDADDREECKRLIGGREGLTKFTWKMAVKTVRVCAYLANKFCYCLIALSAWVFGDQEAYPVFENIAHQRHL